MSLAENRPEWLARVLDSVPSEVAVIDSAGTVLYVNRAWREFADDTNGSLACLAGANYRDVCARSAADGDETAKALLQVLDQLLSGGTENFECEYPCHTEDRHRWFRMMLSAMDAGGKRFVIVQHLEITERVEAELRLSALERRHRMVVESLGEGIVVTNEGGRIVSANPAAEALLGERGETLAGRNLCDILDVPAPAGGMRVECNYYGGRAENVALDVAVYAIPGADSELFVWTLQDVSSLKRERSRRSSEMGSLERLSRNGRPPGALDQQHWQELESKYRKLLEDTLAATIFGEFATLAARCEQFAAELADSRADPRDVVRLHTSVLRQLQRLAGDARARALADEGRLLLLRVIADLGSHYLGLRSKAAGQGGAGSD